MRVLVADDDRVFQLILGRALSNWGYKPLIVADGDLAWQQLMSSEGPQFALLDWMMPKLDGPEVCRRVRTASLSRYSYIILLTGRTEPNALLAGLESGADDYLAKPVNLAELRLRLQTGCRLLESEERHRVITEAASDGIVTMQRGRTIHLANPAASRILRVPASELIGQQFSRFVPGFEEYINNSLAEEERGDRSGHHRSWPPTETPGRYGDGQEAMFELSVCESVGTFQGRAVTAMIRDVTERKFQERQRTQAQKLESIGQLAAGIAHEINTPIQYIGDNGRFLEQAFHDLVSAATVHTEIPSTPIPASPDGVSDGEIDLEYLRSEIPKAIGQLLEGVDHVARIVRAMKEFSHPGPAEKTMLDINKAIESTIMVSKNEWKYVADVITEFDEGLPLVPCLGGQFNQVILNLIVNAAHAISESVTGTARKGLITISTRRLAALVEIRVRDNGAGVPEAIRSKVFDPFFTTKDVGKGTGQGLALAHAVVVKRHHGSISFDSEVGVGTTFVIQLPQAGSETDFGSRA